MSDQYIPSAFPILERGYNGLELTDPGMTLRDYFAGQIISAVYKEYIAGVRNKEHPYQEGGYVGVSIEAYRFADAMLEARKEYEQQPEPENPHRALLLQIHTELSHVASYDEDEESWEGHTLRRIEKLLWPENTGGNHETG